MVKDIQELRDMGLVYWVYEMNAPDDADPIGFRLTEAGIKMTETFSEEILHPSYYKWRLE